MAQIASAYPITWNNQGLGYSQLKFLDQLSENVQVLEDPTEVGVFIKAKTQAAASRLVLPIGKLANIKAFTSCHRYEPFWMTCAAGTRGGEIPIESQYVLAELTDGSCLLIVPLISGDFRCSVQGHGEDYLEVVAESNDLSIVTDEVTCLFLAAGSNPYTLMEDAAVSVGAFHGTGRRRVEKPLPAFVDQFGWCTWDAFYQEVTQQDVRDGLESFAEGGVQPKLFILDDGWQSVRKMPGGEMRLTGYHANEKFPGDLSKTVQMAKGEYGIDTFLVWHAVVGYWGGVDESSLPGYGVRAVPRTLTPGLAHYVPEVAEWWGKVVGLVSPEQIYRFYQDYHRHLRQQGVDGVKVDNQASLELVAAGSGGRVKLMQAYHEALEGSAQTHFRGALINCMSNANEMHYCTLNSTLTRTSTDFWPKKPETHGLHLYVNAQVGMWFGEFNHPDWDMFQSGHPMGAFHAAGRAVSGGPVYVSDKPTEHDFDLLRKLVLPDGTVLRAIQPGRPTRDCLFFNPVKSDVLLKIFSLNRENGVLGVFNARYEEGKELPPLKGAVRPDDVEGLEGSRFAVYAHNRHELTVLRREDAWEIELPQLTAEIFTLSAIQDGLAPLGLMDMYNSGGAILDCGFCLPTVYEMVVRGCGNFLVWSEREPRSITIDGRPAAFSYQAEDRVLTFELPMTDASVVQIHLH